MNPKKETQQEFNTTLSTENVNGKDIPVAVHVPVNNGEAVNNVDIKDMSPKFDTPLGQFDMATMIAMHQKVDSIINRKVLEETFVVVKKYIVEGNQMSDRKTKEPLFNGDGSPRMFADKYFIVVLAQGEDMKIPCDKTMYDFVEIDQRYLFKGKTAWVTEYGNREWKPVYTSAVPIALAS